MRRVDVLRAVAGAQGAAAETDDTAAFIADGDDQAIAEAIVYASVLVPHSQADFDYIVVLVAQTAQGAQHEVPAVRSVSDLESLDGFVVQAAPLAQVGADPGRGFAAQSPLKKLRRARGDAAQPLKLIVAAFLRRRLPLQLHAGFSSQFPQRFFKVPAVQLLGERKKVAAFSAGAKTMPGLPRRIDDKGRRLLIMERTASLMVAPGFFQAGHKALDITDYVDASLNVIRCGHGLPLLEETWHTIIVIHTVYDNKLLHRLDKIY